MEINNELMVLGAILNSTESASIALKLLNDNDFSDSKHKIILKAIQDVFKEKKSTDIYLISTLLKKEGSLETIGGLAYLMTLSQYAGTSCYIEAYCDDLKKATQKRELILLNIALSNDLKQDIDESKIIEKLKNKIGNLEKYRTNAEGKISQIGEILDGTKSQIDNRSFIEKINERHELYKQNGKPFLTGVPTGFVDLDKQAVILEDTNLIIIAARPAMGKTALALNISAYTCFEKDIGVGIISLEMGRDQLSERLISMQTMISGEKIKRGTLTAGEIKKIAEESERIADKPLYIIDHGCSTITQVVATSRRLKESKDIGLLVLDYLQLLGTGGSSDSRQYEVAEISRSLKLLAMELKIPILCVAQLSRKVEERTDKKPLLSDLRDSGQIEQDADAILFIYRRSYYEKSDKPHEADLLLKKNRHGPEAETKLHFDKDCGKFSNLSPLTRQINL